MTAKRRNEKKPASPPHRETGSALRESEQRLRLALAGTNQGLYDLDLQTGRALVSDEYARMLGYEPDELVFTADWWREHLHPDDREAADRVMGECMRGERTEYRIEYRLMTKSGGWKWILSLGKVVENDPRGVPLRMLGTHMDVTERKRRDEELQDARRLLEAVIEQSPVPMVVASAPDLTVRLANRAAIESLGIADEPSYIGFPALEALKSQSWRDFYMDGSPIRPEDLPLAQALLGKAVQNLEYILQRKDGSRRWHMASGVPVYAADERLIAGVVAFPDITDLRQARESLLYRRDFEHLISDISSRFVNLGVADADGAIHEALGAIGSFTGADRSFLFFFRDDGIRADNTHEWCAQGVQSRMALRRDLETDAFPGARSALMRSEVVLIPRVADLPAERSEERRGYEREGIRGLLLVPIRFRGTVAGFLGLASMRGEASWGADAASLLRIVGEVFASALDRKKNEEALRASEERYRIVSDISNHLLYDLSVATGEITWMGRIEELTGFDAAEFNAMGVAGWEGLIHPEDRRETVTLLQEAMRVHAPFRAEYRIRRKDGSYMPVEDHGVFFYGQDGVSVRMVGFMSDETERKTAQADRARLQEQLQQAMKMEAVGRLAGGVAHDFNNLLTTIMGNAELARMQDGVPEAAAASLGEINKAAESAASLTLQLLAFSRRQIIEPRVLNLNDLVTRLEKMITRLIGEDVTMRTSLAPDLRFVRVDPGQFEQVIVNLAVNARDAMPEGGHLVIETGNVELDEGYCRVHSDVKPGPYVMLSVSDSGHGMSEEVKSHLFEPFFTTKPTGRGTGLGLATIFGTVKQAGGAVEVYSEVGRGTTFKVYVPRISAEARAPEDEPADRSPKGTGTILLVEDEEGVREMARKIIERLGYSVRVASGGDEALLKARECGGRIDLLLTDVVMPGLNGRQLADRLTQIYPDMKVLYTSGYTEDVAVLHGVMEANLHFIGKPYSMRRLAAKIKEVLNPAPKPRDEP